MAITKIFDLKHIIPGLAGIIVGATIVSGANEPARKYMYNDDIKITGMVQKADKNKNRIFETKELVDLLGELNYEVTPPIPEHVVPYFEITTDEFSIQMLYGHIGPILEVKIPEGHINKYLRN